jgi:hypothetical protein
MANNFDNEDIEMAVIGQRYSSALPLSKELMRLVFLYLY